MSTRALLLAVALTNRHGIESFEGDAANELRRLHEENERLGQINFAHEIKLSVRGYEIQIADLEAQRHELLEALKVASKAIREYRSQGAPTVYWDDVEAQANAAIKKAEGTE
jgi:hypothetical protein